MVPSADQTFYGCPEIIKMRDQKYKGLLQVRARKIVAPKRRMRAVLRVSKRSLQFRVHKYRQAPLGLGRLIKK